MKRNVFVLMVWIASILLGCEEENLPRTPLEVDPKGAEVMYNDLLQFSASGGQPPYTFTMPQNISGGSVNSETGLYQAGSLAPGIDRVLVTDSQNMVAEAIVQVIAPLSITSSCTQVLHGDSLDFRATGGHPPYVFSISVNRSGGTIDPGSGMYTAGEVYDVVDVIEVEDSSGTTATTTVEVLLTFPLIVSPQNTMALAGTGKMFAVSGGTPPYSVVFSQNVSGGTVGISGANVNYTAGGNTNGTNGSLDIIDVSDSSLSPLTVQVSIVVPGLVISPANASVTANSSVQFTQSGGLPPYCWSLATNASGGSISQSGLYSSGPYSGVDVVALTDANGTMVNTYVNVSVTIITGQTNFSYINVDGLDFDASPILIPGSFPVSTQADIFFEYMISCLMPTPPNLPVIVSKNSALAIFDAGTNTNIDPRSVSYNSSVVNITIGTYTGIVDTPIPNKTICVKTQEGFYVRMVLPNGQSGPCVYTIFK
jgi:hypothetical protein